MNRESVNQDSAHLATERDLIPVSDAMQVVYCPRNFYYRFVAGMDDQNARMLQGTIEDSGRLKRRAVYRTGTFQFRDATLFSYELGLIGKSDAIEETPDGPVPVENKTGEANDNPYDRVQLCAYGMMLEEMREVPVRYGFLYYTGSRKRVRIDFTEELRQKVIAAVEQVWEILEGNEIPQPLDDPRCTGCALASVCMPDQVNIMSGNQDRCASGVAPRSTYERTVFIDEGWGSVGKKDNTMTVKQGDVLKAEIPFESFDQIFLLGHINISGALLSELFARNIFVAFFSSRGRFEGTLAPEKSRYADLRLKQYAASTDESRRLEISKELIDSKLANMRVLLRRSGAKTEDGNDRLMESISAIRKQVFGCRDAGTLLGIEGSGSRTYFEGFRKQFAPEWNFQKRTKRPPRDPVNAALSFGYSILAGQLTGLIQAVGMDPYIGFLHREQYGKPCLALDLMEVFRPVVVDSVVLRMFSTAMVNPGCFEMPSERSFGCFLNEKGRESFFRAYSQRMEETATHPVFQIKLPYRRLLEMEVRFLAKYLAGEVERFQPYRVR